MHARITRHLTGLDENARDLVTADALRAMNALGGRPSTHFEIARRHLDAGTLTWTTFHTARS